MKLILFCLAFIEKTQPADEILYKICFFAENDPDLLTEAHGLCYNKLIISRKDLV